MLDGNACNFMFSAKVENPSSLHSTIFKFTGVPLQMKVRFKGYGTWLFFKTGSCRLLGCPSIAASESSMKMIEHLLDIVRSLRLTNFTYVFKVPLLNSLSELSDLCNRKKEFYTLYTPELFNALSLKVGRINVNIFTSGSVVVTGLKEMSQIPMIRSIVFSLVVDAMTEV